MSAGAGPDLDADGALARLQYAGSHLHTALFVVLGHEGCGAVRAARSSEELMHDAVEANVRHTIKSLLATPEAKAGVTRGMRLVGAVYELDSGRVRFLE